MNVHTQVLERRLASAEARLAGVTNLRGRLMALDVVAQELGVTVPDAHYVSPATDTAGSGAGSSGTAGACCSGGEGSGGSSRTDTTASAANSALPAAAPAFHPACISGGSAPSHGGGDSLAASGGARPPAPLAISGGAVPSRTRQELDALRAQLEAAQAEGRGARDALARLEVRVGALTQELAAAEDRQTSSAARQQDAAQSLVDALAAQLAALRREALRPPEVSLAEFSRMQSAVSRAVEDSQSAAQGARAAQEAGVSLRSAVEELQRRVGRALGVRDADRALNEGLEALRRDLAALSARVDAAQAAALAGEGVASQSQLRELLDHMRGGVASKADVRAVLGRSVELALDAYRRAAGDVAGSGATRFRCAAAARLPAVRAGLGANARPLLPFQGNIPNSSSRGIAAAPPLHQVPGVRPRAARPTEGPTGGCGAPAAAPPVPGRLAASNGAPAQDGCVFAAPQHRCIAGRRSTTAAQPRAAGVPPVANRAGHR